MNSVAPAPAASAAPSPAAWPSIRLVTPSYNQADYIGLTIDSVLSQHYPNLTYFVADGGSQDRTVEILQEKLKPEQWRSRRDGGQVPCLIENFQPGNEEILCWVNSDDVLLPGALQAVGEAFRAFPDAAMVYGNGVFIDSAGKRLRGADPLPPRIAYCEERCLYFQPSTFFRRSWFEKVGGFRANMSKAFDFELFLKIMKAGGPCVFVPQELSGFRVHPEGQTTALWMEFLPEELAVQWWHGDRRQFARRYALKRFRLTSKNKGMTPEQADGFLEPRLDKLIGHGDWRKNLGAMHSYYRGLARWRSTRELRCKLCRFPALAWSLLMHPVDIWHVTRVSLHGLITGLPRIWYRGVDSLTQLCGGRAGLCYRPKI